MYKSKRNNKSNNKPRAFRRNRRTTMNFMNKSNVGGPIGSERFKVFANSFQSLNIVNNRRNLLTFNVQSLLTASTYAPLINIYQKARAIKYVVEMMPLDSSTATPGNYISFMSQEAQTFLLNFNQINDLPTARLRKLWQKTMFTWIPRTPTQYNFNDLSGQTSDFTILFASTNDVQMNFRITMWCEFYDFKVSARSDITFPTLPTPALTPAVACGEHPTKPTTTVDEEKDDPMDWEVSSPFDIWDDETAYNEPLQEDE
jgi:hypothetical protein